MSSVESTACSGALISTSASGSPSSSPSPRCFTLVATRGAASLANVTTTGWPTTRSAQLGGVSPPPWSSSFSPSSWLFPLSPSSPWLLSFSPLSPWPAPNVAVLTSIVRPRTVIVGGVAVQSAASSGARSVITLLPSSCAATRDAGAITNASARSTSGSMNRCDRRCLMMSGPPWGLTVLALHVVVNAISPRMLERLRDFHRNCPSREMWRSASRVVSRRRRVTRREIGEESAIPAPRPSRTGSRCASGRCRERCGRAPRRGTRDRISGRT